MTEYQTVTRQRLLWVLLMVWFVGFLTGLAIGVIATLMLF